MKRCARAISRAALLPGRRGDGTLPHPLQFPLRRGRVIAGEVIRLTVRLLREQGAPWGPESPASALHTSGSARPISPPPGMMPARQRGFYSEVLDAELEPTSQADLKQVRRAPPSAEPRMWLPWLEKSSLGASGGSLTATRVDQLSFSGLTYAPFAHPHTTKKCMRESPRTCQARFPDSDWGGDEGSARCWPSPRATIRDLRRPQSARAPS